MKTSGANSTFDAHRALFESKGLLRWVYREDFFPRLQGHCAPGGPTVEIGSGAGMLKADFPGLLATDLVPRPGNHAALDACRLPFAANSLRNVVGLDVLHHLPDPMQFLRSAEIALGAGGRCVLIEPWLTPFSRILYRHFHREDCDEKADPFSTGSAKDPMEGNQAIPFLLFGRHQARTLANLMSTRLVKLEPFSGPAYLLSLGFRSGSLAPGGCYPFLHGLENFSGRLWKSWAALRALIVLEKSGT